ncbi:MAG TPA: helical backbone metal receptor [Polyangia bacterium]|nr:helical backbone metal receptor [Polyangia bacterium]
MNPVSSVKRAACAAVMLLLARAAHAEIAVKDDRGVTVTFARPPRRIISLLPSLTETVCALDACDRLVGVDRFSSWPARIAALPKLGGMEDAQIERIVALAPDVVLVESSVRAAARLEGLGVRVIALHARDRADVERTLTLLATMLGAEQEAARLRATIERDVAAAAARVPASLRGQRVYFEVDATPYGAGPTSFIGQTFARLGMDNILPASLGPFPKLNPEFVVRAQPDVVIGIAAAVADMPKRPGWGSLRAFAAGKTCALPTARYDLVVRPGPRLGEAAAVLADCLAAIARSPL